MLHPEASVVVYIDSLIVALGAKEQRRTGPFAGLWAELWRLEYIKSLTIDIRWLKPMAWEIILS